MVEGNTLPAENSQPKAEGSNVLAYVVISLIVLVIIVVVVLKIVEFIGDAQRYSLAAKALESGNANVAAAALAPDVGRGFGAGLGALGLRNLPKSL